MAYDPTNWVEGVTPLGPVNLNKIEQGIVSAHGRVDELIDQPDLTGDVSVSNSSPKLKFLDTTPDAKSCQLRCDGNNLYVDEVDAAGELVANRITINLVTGFVTGDIDKVDGFHLRANAGNLEYSTDGVTWTIAGWTAAQIRAMARRY